MSTEVGLSELAATVAGYRFAYLLTASADGAPRAVAVVPVCDGDELVVGAPGRRTLANALAQPAVSLVWPPADQTQYSLIVDGQARATDDSLRIRPSRAVLHRPAPRPQTADPSACAADCREIDLPPAGEGG